MTPDYKDWTVALYEALLANRPADEAIYLQIDENTLEEIALNQVAQQTWTEQSHLPWFACFLEAVKQFLAPNGHLELDALKDRYVRLAKPHEQLQGLNLVNVYIAPLQLKTEVNQLLCPLSLGFLVLQVLVASQMQSDQSYSANNYYNRLVQVLNNAYLSQSQRKVTLTLWQQYNYWLRLRSWIPTATEGTGPQRFIQYPISQCLLRQSDRQKLHQLMHQSCKNNQSMNPERMQYWVLQHREHMTKHMQTILLSWGDLKCHELLQEIYTFYLDRSWLQPLNAVQQGQQRRLKAGLYRYENFITGDLEFRPYPEMRRLQSFSNSLTVELEQQILPLRYHRPGFYQALDIPVKNPEQSQSYPIYGSAYLQELLFVGSDCWALVADPLAPNSGVYATWQHPTPAEAFYFICLDRYHSDLLRLKQHGLISWDEPFYTLEMLTAPGNQTWREYQNMQILDIHPQSWAAMKLPESLRYWLEPQQQQMGLVIQGGLPTRGSGDYLFGFPLRLKILAAAGEYHVCLKDLGQPDQDQAVLEFEQVANQEFLFEFPAPGCYELQISGTPLRRRLNALRWQDLNPRHDQIQRYNYILDEEGLHLMEGGRIWHV